MVAVRMLVALIGCMALLEFLEWLSPADEHQPGIFKRKGVKLDVGYWVVLGLLDKLLFRYLIAIGLIGFFLFMGWVPSKEFMQAGFGPVMMQPKWLQLIEALLIADFVYYWLHRTFHRPAAWKYHAIHHSSENVDYLSSKRGHPINSAGNRILPALTVLLMGFPPTVLGSWAIILTMWDMMIHANLDWNFGPLKYVVASPVFHRWHHTLDTEAQDKNFSGMFPLWDILFGTCYMPKGKLPKVFGVTEPMPETIVGQIMYPWKSQPADATAPAEAPIAAAATTTEPVVAPVIETPAPAAATMAT